MDQFKCAYCKWTLKYDQFAQHSCFADTSVDSLVMDSERNVFVPEIENMEDTFDKNRLDEDLITAVQNRPALYDFRLPLKQRGKKEKDDLWNEVSIYLKGSYTPSEAEKRWNYLKDCYRKARNLFKKRQVIQQRSGSAGTSKSESIMPSFRHYDSMMFLNDILEHRQTVTSLRESTGNQQASTSTRTLPHINLNDVQSNMENDSMESESSVYSHSVPSVKSKKRKRSLSLVEDATLLNALTENKDPSPIDGFVLRLAEGLRRLTYKQRSKLEIEFLKRLYEIEEAEEV